MRTMFQDKTRCFGVSLISMLLLPVFAGCGPQARNVEGGDAPIEMEAQRSELQGKTASERLPGEEGTESKDRIVLDDAGGAFIERVSGPMPILLRESVEVGPPNRADGDGSFTTAHGRNSSAESGHRFAGHHQLLGRVVWYQLRRDRWKGVVCERLSPHLRDGHSRPLRVV